VIVANLVSNGMVPLCTQMILCGMERGVDLPVHVASWTTLLGFAPHCPNLQHSN